MPPPRTVQLIQPGNFDPYHHWYPKALNATIHPLVHFFLHLQKHRIIQRYCHLHPRVKAQALSELLAYKPRHFFWSGADLMHVTNEDSKRQMVIIETNSCPSGQKSMPLTDEVQEQGGYKLLVERTIGPFIKSRKTQVAGDIAVLFDKNPMEASGYAHALADYLDHPVHYLSFYQNEPDPGVQFRNGVLYIRDVQGDWKPVRAAFRYVTQKPWNRLPLHSKTHILNPVVACLAGGRNKMVAAKAYENLNQELASDGLAILTPETIWDVSKEQIPLWVEKMGGQAVIKIPYSNAGQGVFTIVNQEELNAFMAQEFRYERFIVQSLIGNYQWSSTGSRGKLYHVGTMPSEKGNTYVADIRMMVSSTPQGIRPLAVYARRAAKPLADVLEAGAASWDILGTNLSIKKDDGTWDSDTSRLMMMDRRDFNKLSIGLDDLIDAYIQTVLSTVAIDKMAEQLFNAKGRFRMRLFESLNDDRALLDEILM